MFSGTRSRINAPPLMPPPPPVGVAYEIHHEFKDFKIIDFMEFINTKIGSQTNFINKTRPLQPLIDYINANSNIDKLDLIDKINTIYDKLKLYGGYESNKSKITKCVQYILMQPQQVIDTYIQTLITDCLKAYSTGPSESCIKGMYERIFYSFRDTMATICLDQIQGNNASPLCKPEYLELYGFFSLSNAELNRLLKDWYNENAATDFPDSESKKESFLNYVKTQINEERFKLLKSSIEEYADEVLPNMLGGKKRDKRSVKKRSVKKRSVKKH